MKTILIEGQQYGKWTVVRFDCVDDRRRRRYICKCQCGLEISLVASRVAAGATKQCKNCRKLNIIGMQFGDWKVLNYLHQNSTNKSVWSCRCSCGQVEKVIGSNLMDGGSTCCFACGHKKKCNTKIVPCSWWYKQQCQARLRKIEWNLKEDEALQVLEDQHWKCKFSGVDISFDPITASIDRIVSSGNYCTDNIQWVHCHINLMKYKFGAEYFIEMCGKVWRTCESEDIHRLVQSSG